METNIRELLSREKYIPSSKSIVSDALSKSPNSENQQNIQKSNYITETMSEHFSINKIS